jgi:hypothetical protein
VCTLSWWRDGTSYGVFFNRDESRMRLEAEIPCRFETSGISYLSPVDADGGGTWIWANSEGVIGCLLNNYQVNKEGAANPVSRGLLLKSLASRQHTESLFDTVEMTDLHTYRGFLIFGMDRNTHGLITWDCDNLQFSSEGDVHSPITSSGYLPEEIISHRKNLYHSRFDTASSPSAEELFSYHTLHDPALPAHSVLMCRPDARTVSLSQVSVDPERIRFSYGTVSEQCRFDGPTTISLNRVD